MVNVEFQQSVTSKRIQHFHKLDCQQEDLFTDWLKYLLYCWKAVAVLNPSSSQDYIQINQNFSLLLYAGTRGKVM